MRRREPEPEVDRGRDFEQLRLARGQRLIELVDAARELREIEIGLGEIVAQRLQRPPRIRRRAGGGRDVALEMIDDEPEPFAKLAQRWRELARHVDRDIAAELRGLHRLPVKRNHVSLMPFTSRPREYPISNVPGTKKPKNASSRSAPPIDHRTFLPASNLES